MKAIGTSFAVLLWLAPLAARPQLYVDVLTPIAMSGHATSLSVNMQSTSMGMQNLRNAQGWVAAQMTIANSIQNKLYNGLKEVNGTLQNGLQVKRIYDNLTRMSSSLDDIRKEVRNAPEFSVFAVKAGDLVVRKTIELGADVADLLLSGDLNLATSGDRRRLLGNIEQNTRLLNFYLLNVKLSIRRAKRKGFWQAANPFQSYVNTDRQIFDQIVRNSKRF